MFLLRRLWSKEFYSVIAKDENRVGDGLYLRYIYCEETGADLTALNLECGQCRVLEVLIALVSRGYSLISFDKTGIGRVDFFYLILNNILSQLSHFSDKKLKYINDPYLEIDKILCQFLDRRYGEDSSGCAFPSILRQKELKKAELWSQMNNYIVERDLF